METNTNERRFASLRGQTLIETIAALFILTTGLISGLALATSTFAGTSEGSEKIVATGLAREGIEIVRRMRDSNWLAAKTRSGLVYCSDLGADQSCYPTWLSERYDISGQSGEGLEYRAIFDPTNLANKWSLSPADSGSDFRLYKQPGGEYSHIQTLESTNFFRKINIVSVQTTAPYSASSPLLLVRVTVWWQGKHCPQISYLNNPQDTSCKIVTEEYLANWRNY
jgi:hypothetical protein